MMITLNTVEAGLTATYCLQMSVETHTNVGFCALSAEAPEGSAAEPLCRLPSQRLFTRILRIVSFILGTRGRKQQGRPGINVEEE